MTMKNAINPEDDLDTRDISEHDRAKEALPAVKKIIKGCVPKELIDVDKVTVMDDDIDFDNGTVLFISKEDYSVSSILKGTETLRLWQWVVGVVRTSNGSYWEPPDTDIEEVLVTPYLSEAVGEVAITSLRGQIDRYLEGER
jgi:hypothetical protein